MGGNLLSAHQTFQFITNFSSNSFTLVVFMNKQSVQVAGVINITEANDFIILNCDYRMMFQK